MRMPLPRWFVISMLAAGVTMLAASTYVENRFLPLLNAHPIWANLLSGVVAFCFGVPAVSVVIGQLSDYRVEQRYNESIRETAKDLAAQLRWGISRLEHFESVDRTRDWKRPHDLWRISVDLLTSASSGKRFGYISVPSIVLALVQWLEQGVAGCGWDPGSPVERLFRETEQVVLQARTVYESASCLRAVMACHNLAQRINDHWGTSYLVQPPDELHIR